MRRLLYVISFTSQIEESKRFYRDILGLKVGTDSPYWVDFTTEGTGLALLAVNPGTVKGVELCFESEDVERSMDALIQRGVTFTDELRRLAFGSVIHFRDTENNLLSLLQPSPAAADPAPASTASTSWESPKAAEGGKQTSLALEEQTALSTGEPRLTAAIIHSLSYPTQQEFYREKLGLKAGVQSDHWVAFDTGPLALVVRPRVDRIGTPQHGGQPVSFGFEVDDLSAWMEIGRERGVTFLTGPTQDAMGLVVEAVDPEGNVLTFREPGFEESLEEQLAAPFEDEAVPHQAAFRKPIAKGTRATSRVVIKPAYKKTGARKKASLKGRLEAKPKVAKPRGAGPVRSRVAPKRKGDLKRPRALPAIGRAKKAVARSAKSKKSAVAKTSRAKPVKRAVRQTRAGTRGKRSR